MYRYQIRPYRTTKTHSANCYPNYEKVHTTGFRPKTDVFEDDNNFYFSFEIPGITKEDVKLSVNDENVLTIKGEKKIIREEGINYFRRELSDGNFERQFYLPDNIESEKITAKFDNGVLNVSIPKIEEVKKNIEINLN